MVACFLWCYQHDESPPLSKCAIDLLKSLRYPVPTVSSEYAVLSNIAGSERKFFVSKVELNGVNQHASSRRFPQSLTRLQCLLNSVGRLEQHDQHQLPTILNSLSIVTAVGLSMLSHPRRDDLTLRFGRAHVSAGFHWLLYDNSVYDIAPHRDVANFRRKISQIFLFLGVPPKIWDDHSEHTTLLCTTALLRTMKSLDPGARKRELTANSLKGRLTKLRLEDQLLGEEELCVDARRDAVIFLHSYMSAVLKTQYPECSVHMYGSCYSGLSNATGDVDLSLHIPNLPCNHELSRQTAESVLENVCFRLNASGSHITGLEAATKARVPVVRGSFNGGDDILLDFDITLNNNLGVANSELLLQYSQVDDRVKWLMNTVKAWAKSQGIASTKDHYLSSYAWMNLAIFYLEVLGFVPNLQSKELQRLAGIQALADCPWQNVDGLDTSFLTWKQASSVWEVEKELNELTRTQLLYGFFMFYTNWYPTALYTISICHGGYRLKDETMPTRGLFLSIEDPFETFDSTRPHDLGRHMDAAGAARVAQCLHAAALEMGNP